MLRRPAFFSLRMSSRTMTSSVTDKADPVLPVYTRVLPVDLSDLGTITFTKPNNYLAPWTITPSASDSGANLLTAADALQSTLYPVAFPTETVYGLGANALSPAAVRGIFTAKQRPSDNPLIVHVSSLEMLRRLLDPLGTHAMNGTNPIPTIYHELISRFWPGPLSILLANPEGSRIAKEVTAGQPTFAARMPSNKLALALVQLANLPLAAPSANASTKPSPTTAQHVAHDLAGKIEIILDGGSCDVGVESTVVDGLSSPPAILRPGGIGIEELRSIPGWEDVVIGYKDATFDATGEKGGPRAPGMKYKHYSPAARVILAEAGTSWNTVKGRIESDIQQDLKIGIVRTKTWPVDDVLSKSKSIHSLYIGPSTSSIARGLFSALRDLDLKGVDVIYIEGIFDGEHNNQESGHSGENGTSDSLVSTSNGTNTSVIDATAAAVMNRLRKAAVERI